MKRIVGALLIFLAAAFPPLLIAGAFIQAHAGGTIKVVATTLDMADLVETIGGDRVEVEAIFTGRTDIHFFEPIPSQVMKLKRAEMLIVAGLDADVWVKGLIDAARNSRIRFGSSGYVDPSDGVRPIQVPEGRIDGAMGHVHPYGNPHYWLDPDNILVAVDNIYQGLVRLRPEEEQFFRANRDALRRQIEETWRELKEKMKPFEGTKVIEYHQSWDYFCRALGLEIIATLEPKPGIPPSAKHLGEVVRITRSGGARLMLIEPYYPEKPVSYVSRETGVEALRLPVYLGSVEGIDSHADLIRYNVNRIVEALAKKG